MHTYEIAFNGRKKNTLGVTYAVTARREAPDPAKAVVALYDEYENILVWSVKEIKE